MTYIMISSRPCAASKINAQSLPCWVVEEKVGFISHWEGSRFVKNCFYQLNLQALMN